jgi:virulence factor Mce-like protein
MSGRMSILSRADRRLLVAALVLALLAVGLYALRGGGTTRTVTAHFSRAVSVYPGTDDDVMGLPIGRVTAVVPDGDSVRVEMEYDGQYHLPADVKAAVITPTLVSDRFVQLAPAYGGGAVLADGGDIPLPRTAVPVELDRIYASLADLTTALGPQGANRDGALGDLLHVSARALRGNGRLGHDMLANLSQAARTLGDTSPQLFGTVEGLAGVTRALQANDRLVGDFTGHLARVSTQLAGERGDLRRALAAIARAVGIVRSFVHDNRSAVVGDVKGLTTTLGVLSKRKDTLAKVIQLGALGLGNLAESNDPRTGTVGIRLQIGPAALDLGNMLCNVVKVNHAPNAGEACTLLKALLPNASDVGAGFAAPSWQGGALPAGSGLGGLLGGVSGLLGGAGGR